MLALDRDLRVLIVTLYSAIPSLGEQVLLRYFLFFNYYIVDLPSDNVPAGILLEIQRDAIAARQASASHKTKQNKKL